MAFTDFFRRTTPAPTPAAATGQKSASPEGGVAGRGAVPPPRPSAARPAPRPPSPVTRPPAVEPKAEVVEIAKRPAYTKPKLVHRLEELPRYSEVLSLDNGAAALDANDHGTVALLKVGDGLGAVVWTGRLPDSEVMRYAKFRLMDAGYKCHAVYHADSDLIHTIHAHAPRSGLPKPDEQVDEIAMEKRLDTIIANAIQRNASDIHFRIRHGRPTTLLYRINGELLAVQQFPEDVGVAMATAMHRLGSQAGKTGIELDMRKPQDANIERGVVVESPKGPKAVKVNLRFGSTPERTGGVNVVLRVIVEEDDAPHWPLEKLGYPTPQVDAFEKALMAPEGVIVLVGTTGSGKSRTLQTCCGMIYERYGESRNLVTAEQPVEYVIPGASQTPVPKSEDSSVGFAGILRAMMRTDPDVIMVGEVRDDETGEVLQHAVQTGHKVLTTLHASDCIQAMARLISLGVEKEVLCSEGFVNLIVCQKLVPVVCPHCALGIAEAPLSGEAKVRLLRAIADRPYQLRFRNPEGCPECNFTSIVGRTVCAEFYVPDNDVLQLLSEGKITAARKMWRARAARRAKDAVGGVQGVTMKDNAIEKMCKGIICPTDVEKLFDTFGVETSPESALSWIEAHCPDIAQAQSGSALRHGMASVG